jgi:ribonuclease HI
MLQDMLQIMFKVSNNVSEYDAALHGLRITISLGIKQLIFMEDSTLVANQVNKM